MSYKDLKEFHSNKNSEEYKKLMRKRVRKWRKEPAIVRIEHPTNPARARSLGWKNKKSFLVVRSRVRKGTMRKSRPSQGRKTKSLGITGVSPDISLQEIAEQRVGKKYPNCRVLNSYEIADGGDHKYFEVLLKVES